MARISVVKRVQAFTRSGYGPKRTMGAEARKTRAGRLKALRGVKNMYGKKFSTKDGLPMTYHQKKAFTGKAPSNRADYKKYPHAH